MDRLEEKRKIKAQAFHERKVCAVAQLSRLLCLLISLRSSQRSSCAKRLSQTRHHPSRSLRSSVTRWYKYMAYCIYNLRSTMTRCHEIFHVATYCSSMPALWGHYVGFTEYDAILSRNGQGSVPVCKCTQSDLLRGRESFREGVPAGTRLLASFAHFTGECRR